MKIRYSATILVPLVLILAFAAQGVQAQAQEPDQDFQKIWKQFSDICNDAKNYVVADNKNSRTVLEMLTFREPKYARLLEDARKVLGSAATDKLFNEIDELNARNHKLNAEMVDLRRQRVGAPDSSFNPLKLTKKRIDGKLAQIPEEITANKAAIDNIKHNILADMLQHGIDISEDELNYFLVSAEGNELLRLMNMAENMKKMQQVMEHELEADKNNVDLAKIYTGMYLISLDAYSSAHDVVINNMSEYRERLKSIYNEAMNNYDNAVSLRKKSDTSEQSNIDANIKINERTLDVASMYDNLLKRRIKNLEKSKKYVAHKIDLARNTYKTMINGSNLIDLVNTGFNEYTLLTNFKMPELRAMYDSSVLNAFRDISDRIRNEK